MLRVVMVGVLRGNEDGDGRGGVVAQGEYDDKRRCIIKQSNTEGGCEGAGGKGDRGGRHTIARTKQLVIG